MAVGHERAHPQFLSQSEGVVKAAVKIIARLTYRQRYEQSTGRDPLASCPIESGNRQRSSRIFENPPAFRQ